VYAVVIPVCPLFATSSFAQSTGIRSDTVIGTSLRRACGASCIRLDLHPKRSPKPDFCDRGVSIRATNADKKTRSWRGQLV